jgi:tripartite-type tricarboxylate transporter receptor subunit TctC
LLLLSVISIVGSTLANTQGKPFYQGKTIRILVGSTSGSLYDHWANLLARALSKHIPGQPSMIVQNMRGASGIVAANYGSTVAAPDGLTLVMFHRHVYMEQLIERKEVWFDLRRYQWIGSPDKSPPTLYIRADSPYKTIDDIVKSPNPPKCGATGTSDLTYSMSKVLEGWQREPHRGLHCRQ